jgi:hypothetical protein
MEGNQILRMLSETSASEGSVPHTSLPRVPKDSSFVLGPRLLETAFAELEAACRPTVQALQDLLAVSAPLISALSREVPVDTHIALFTRAA